MRDKDRRNENKRRSFVTFFNILLLLFFLPCLSILTPVWFDWCVCVSEIQRDKQRKRERQRDIDRETEKIGRASCRERVSSPV